MTTPPELRRLNCTVPAKGPWSVVSGVANRSVNVRNRRSGYVHRVYYGTRTKRTQEDAETQAIAMCAVLNLLKAKRP